MDNTDSAADDIASMITQILVKAFKEKEGREPTAEEVEQLIEELTEDRIESMMNGTDAAVEEISQNNNESDVEDDVQDADNDKDENVEDIKTAKPDVPQEKENLSEVGKRTADKTEVVESNENGSPNISNKKAKCDVEVDNGDVNVI